MARYVTKREGAREDRIWSTIVKGARTAEQQSAAWHRYLSNAVSYPFGAKCPQGSQLPPVLPGAHVQVIGLPSADEWAKSYSVKIMAGQKSERLALDALEPLDKGNALEPVWDWLYWVHRGYFDVANQPPDRSGLGAEHR